MDNDKIQLNKYVYFDKTNGRFCLNSEGSELIYCKKNLVCSYSGANEWIHHFVCEMIDFCSGASIYNYALGTVAHEKEIPRIWGIHPDAIITWVKNSQEKVWSKKMWQLIENIIDKVEPV